MCSYLVYQTLSILFSVVPKHTLFYQISKLARAKTIMSDTKFMNTCSFTIHFKKIIVFFKVFVECIIFLGELEEVSSF